MTLYDFVKLDDQERAEAVWKGNFIAAREEGEYRVIIYKLETFFVEVYYHKPLNSIQKLRPFKTTRRLAPYFFSRLN
jgi:hypothetical protein